MALSTLWLVLMLWTSLFSDSQCSTLSQAELQELEQIHTWVVSRSFPCSVTCGLGLLTQELCPIGVTRNISTSSCKLRTISCLDSWQCGLKTQTATVGRRLVLDCLEEVMEAMGRFSFVVSWRFAFAIITTDDSLFTRYEALSLDKVVLDPLREEDSGTYRCDVLDTGKRRVKRMYKGVKVLSPKDLSLDFAQGLIHWEIPESRFANLTSSRKVYSSSTIRNIVIISVPLSFAIAVVIFIFLFCYSRRARRAAHLCQDNI
ncbi:transmembrane protein 81 [Danio rerio]|uniref:Transmembrane protein 81 n=2 Tax=Danio rerio TaxID=7955 RepID=TMM81_DANRE|nr:transmembrane protein 81 [Danio rerio]|eukprot:XP_009302307.1 transmembrane protein 81 [Danio rerio]